MSLALLVNYVKEGIFLVLINYHVLVIVHIKIISILIVNFIKLYLK